jgi:predicted RNA binding protein YcfA (HicA-like mRNA interferase family)
MARGTFSGKDVVKVLINVGGFEWRRTTGDHAQLYYQHPSNESDRRHVTVPLHDELKTGTLRSIADDAGAHDFEAFCEWIDSNS